MKKKTFRIFSILMLIAVDKPLGITSFDVIRALKRELGEKKIGHSGTLDPLASGLMLIGTGYDTKELNNLIGLDKTYETIIDFSKKSDTWDMGYREYYEEMNIEGKDIGLEEVENNLDLLIPEYELPLTPFSAKKKDGKKLYDLARKGEQIIENRLMKTYGYEILDYNFPELRLRLDVGSGTYIRSIGHWLGEQFGLGGILTMLRRIRIGEYELSKIDLDKEGIFFRKGGENVNFKYGIIR